MKRTWIATIVVAGVLSAAREARAQYWLSDRNLEEGRGIRTGNFELHPGIGAEFGYDSNVFYSPSGPVVTPAMRLRVTPSFAISTLGPQRQQNSDGGTPTALPTVNFRGGIALIYHQYIPINSPDTVSHASNLGGNVNFRMELFPRRTWQFVLADDFTRTIQPGPEGAIVTFDRDFNHAAAELAYAPGGGVFDLRFGYAFNVSIFEDSAYTLFNYIQHDISIRSRWRFLPKTALVWDASVRPLSYLNPNPSPTAVGLFSSTPIQTRVGLNGLITEKLRLMLLAGYSATFYSGGDNLDTVIGQAEVQWIINPVSSVRVGFQREILNSFFGNFYLRDRAYLNYTQSFGGRFLFALDGGLGLLDFGYLANPTGARIASAAGTDPTTGRFSAVRAEGTLFSEYRPSDVFGINITLRGSVNISDARLGRQTDARDMMLGQAIAWNKIEAFAGVRANW